MKKHLIVLLIILSNITSGYCQNIDTTLSLTHTTWRTTQVIYRDTVFYTPYALRSESKPGKSVDTLYEWNHIQYLMQECRKQADHWIAKVRKEKDLSKAVDYRMKYDYYTGAAEVLKDLVYRRPVLYGHIYDTTTYYGMPENEKVNRFLKKESILPEPAEDTVAWNKFKAAFESRDTSK